MDARLFVRPRLKARLTFCRLGVPAPLQFSRLRIVRFQITRIVQRIAATPVMTWFSTTSGDIVQKYSSFTSAIVLRQFSVPSFAFSAIRLQSGVSK